jgi:hypothetical protein
MSKSVPHAFSRYGATAVLPCSFPSPPTVALQHCDDAKTLGDAVADLNFSITIPTRPFLNYLAFFMYRGIFWASSAPLAI